jgi:hypothetical protein
MPILESNIYGLWGGKQTAKGAALATPSRRLVWVGAGDFGFSRDDGSETYSDLGKYGAQSDWVNSLLGQGEPGLEATPTELAWLLWMFHGAETVTPVTGPPTAQKHTFVPSTGRGHWGAFWRRLGLNVLQRHRMNDCLVTRIQIEGSTANKAVRVTPRIFSLDPFEVIATDPVVAMPTDKVLLYTDGTGTFTVDGTVYPAHSQFTFVADEDMSPAFGDDTSPHELVQGTPTATIGVTLLFDAPVLALWNTHVYGSASPAAGTKPRKSIPGVGSYSFNLKQRDSAGALNGRELKITLPQVRWALPDAPAPAQGGGTVEVSLAGALRPGASPLYTIDVNTDNAVVAFTT